MIKPFLIKEREGIDLTRCEKIDFEFKIYNRKHIAYIIICIAISVAFKGRINTFLLFALYPLSVFFLILFWFQKRKQKMITLVIFYTTTLMLLLMSTFVSNINVSGHSMSPTLNDGDWKLVIQQNYFIKNNDIVIAMIPSQTDKNQKIRTVKRIVAHKGDRVEFVYETFYIKMLVNNHEIKINNELIEALTIHISNSIIIDDVYFLLGDNYSVSYDSRYYGFINKRDILGKVLF